MAVGLVLKGRKVVVVGANASGVSLTKYLVKKGATVVLADTQSAEKLLPLLQEKIDTSRFVLECGEFQSTLFDGAQVIVLTSGVSLDPKMFESAKAAGAQVVSDVELFALFAEEPLILVGGSKGKTTTVAIASKVLELSNKKTFNTVSQPLSEYLNLAKAADCIVASAGAFQLEGASNLKPQTIVLLNLHEEHPLRYPNFETYLAAQREILRNADAETTLIANADDPHIVQWLQHSPSKKFLFSANVLPEGVEGAWCTKTHMQIRFNGEVSAFELKNFRLRGVHNRENLMAGVLAALVNGGNIATVSTLIDSFAALSGRVEFVKRTNSVVFYNDSCAATVPAVIRTLQSFNDPVILIMGGRDKNLDYSPLIPHVRHRVKNLILVGEAKEKINRALGDYTETFLVGTLEEAALMAYQKSRSGDVVLLSPACDSRDAYANHEERGEHFKKLIGQMSQPRKIAYI